jgi:uncharacterized damage-inducible protein DinB
MHGQPTDQPLRDTLAALLDGGQAHVTFDAAVADLPPKARGQRIEGLPHTAWRLVEHMRLCQKDILEYALDPDWQSPPWPTGYWPEGDAPPSGKAWQSAIADFRRDLARLRALVLDPAADLLSPIPHGLDASHTIARQAMLAADHNAYHLGQLITLRRALGQWAE